MKPIRLTLLPFFLLTSLLLFSCDKIPLEEQKSDNGTLKVTFRIASIENIPFENTFSRADFNDLCTRFSIALFQGGNKVKSISQTSEEAGFGTITFSLIPGTYQLVAIAHNGQGHCSISSPEKITFANNKLTDTFFYYGIINVQEPITAPLTLKRPVSMFRLKITDTIPSEVVQMKFYYTGGSSTFNAVSGYGCVNSRQTEIFSLSTLRSASLLDASLEGQKNPQPSTFSVYTFPHEANDFIDMTITALDAQGQTVAEKTLGNLYIQPNVITQHTCRFFNDSISTTTSFSIENDGRWQDLIEQ